MAAAICYIAATKVELIDNWNGAPAMPHIPTTGFTGTDQHNVADAKRKPGTKVQYYDTTSEAWVRMIYLKMGTASTEVAVAAGKVMQVAGPSMNSSKYEYIVTNDEDDILYPVTTGPACIALSAITADYWGWWWCGGGCPRMAKAGCSALAAATIPCYWDVASITAGYVACAGDRYSTAESGLVAASAYNSVPFARLNGVATNV